jgi:DNA-binding response OmpR family regulator
VLLSFQVPEQEGLVVLNNMRRVSAAPVLILAPRKDSDSTVRWLDTGADDYIATPAHLPELLARVETAARRRPRGLCSAGMGQILVDLDARTVTTAGRKVDLTKTEFDVLAVLARNIGVAVSRRKIMNSVWGTTGSSISQSLYVHLNGVRTKLGHPTALQTVRGFGYRLR